MTTTSTAEIRIICIGPIFGIPAVICGHIATGRIKRSNGAMKGNGLALGGLITGYISIAMIPIIALLAAIAVPNFVKARQTAQMHSQMHSCINNLRMIDASKQQWQLEKGKDAINTPTADDILPYLGRGSSNQMLICPAGGVYEINALATPPTCTFKDHVLPQ